MGMIKKVKDYMSKPYSKGDYYAGIAGVVLLYGGLAAAYVIKTKIAEKKAAEAEFEPEYVETQTNAEEVFDAVDEANGETEA